MVGSFDWLVSPACVRQRESLRVLTGNYHGEMWLSPGHHYVWDNAVCNPFSSGCDRDPSSFRGVYTVRGSEWCILNLGCGKAIWNSIRSYEEVST